MPLLCLRPFQPSSAWYLDASLGCKVRTTPQGRLSGESDGLMIAVNHPVLAVYVINMGTHTKNFLI